MIRDITREYSRQIVLGLLSILAIEGAILWWLPDRLKLMLLAFNLGLVVLFFLMKYPQMGIYFLTLYIPLEEFIEKWIPTGPLFEGARFGGEILLIILFIFVLLERAKRNISWVMTPIDLPFLAFIGISILSGLLNNTPGIVGVLGVRPLVRYISVFYILTQLRASTNFHRKVMALTFSVAVLVAAIGLMQTIIGSPLTNLLIPSDIIVNDLVARAGLRHVVAPRTYIFSTMGRYDTLGTYLAFLLILCLGLKPFVTGKLSRLVNLVFIVGLPALVLTFSRQSWIVFLVGAATVLLIGRGKWYSRLRISFILCSILILTLIPLLTPYAQYYGTVRGAQASVFARALELLSPRYLEVSRFNYGRLFVLFEVGPRLIRLSPFLGLGPGQFGSLTARFFNVEFSELVGIPDEAAHFINDVNWITILGQFGLLGVVAFLWMLLSLLRASGSLYNKTTDPLYKGIGLGFIGAVVAIILFGFFGPNFEVRQISFFFWLFAGIVASASGTQVDNPRVIQP